MHAADHATAIRMAAEDHRIELLPPHQVDDIVDVPLEIDVGRQRVALLRHSGERGRKHLVPLIAERAPYPRPTPAAVPGTVYQDKRRHPRSPPDPGL